MATLAPAPFRATRRDLLGDRLLSVATLVLLAVLLAAIVRGRAHWGVLPWTVWAHIATVVPAMALTPALLLRRKADRTHRVTGYAWAALMATTALVSFGIHQSGPGRFSPIHLLSVWTLFMLGWVIAAARAHRVVQHRRRVRGLIVGALLIAGFFTLPFGRVLGTWLAA